MTIAMTAFEQLTEAKQSAGASATIEQLVDSLRNEKDHHKLFDALLLQKKFEMGISLLRPTSFDDVPADRQEEFEASYVAAAREVATKFLEDDDLTQAWLYFRTIREPGPIRQALDAIDDAQSDPERLESLIQIALYDGAHPVKGLEWMLRSHGTCNTITALDQQMQQLTPEDRTRAAALLVRELHNDLTHTIRREIEQKQSDLPADASLRELITGRDWLFEDGNYHIDVSHLHSVVRFARFLGPDHSLLDLAMQLAEYGARLSAQFQYPGDPPFSDFYPAHSQYFVALANSDRDAGLSYFRDQLAQASEDDRALAAYVLVDLLTQIERWDDALAVASEHLTGVDEGSGFSFVDLCQRAGRMDSLKAVALEKGDLVGFTAALLSEETGTQSS